MDSSNDSKLQSSRSRSPPSYHSSARGDGRGERNKRLSSLPVHQTDPRGQIESWRPFPMFQPTGPDRKKARENRTTAKQSLASKQAFAGERDTQLSAVPVLFLLCGGVWRSETPRTLPHRLEICLFLPHMWGSKSNHNVVCDLRTGVQQRERVSDGSNGFGFCAWFVRYMCNGGWRVPSSENMEKGWGNVSDLGLQ